MSAAAIPLPFRRRFVLGSVGDASIALLLLVSVVGIGLGKSAALRYLLPVLTPAVAWVLCKYQRDRYVPFVFWTWFLAPLVRRLIDYQTSWMDPSPVLLAPYFAALIGPLFVGRSIWKAPARELGAFLLVLVSIAWAAAIGMLQNSTVAVFMGLLNWATPVLFALYLRMDACLYRHNRTTLANAFGWGVVVMSVYGMAQFFLAPAWDGFWLTNLNLPSMGKPEPFAFRIFSTMHSAGVFAYAVAAGLLLLYAVPSRWKFPAAFLGATALLLTQIRAAWITALAGGVILLIAERKRLSKPVLTLLSLVIVAVPLTLIEPIHDLITARLQSFSNLGDDTSAGSRMDGHKLALSETAEHPLGHGLGVPEDVLSVYGSFSLRDSTFADVPVTFGWFGSTVYVAGFTGLFLADIRRLMEGHQDRFGWAASACIVGFLIVLPLGSITEYFPGFIVWTCLALAPTLAKPQSSHRSVDQN